MPNGEWESREYKPGEGTLDLKEYKYFLRMVADETVLRFYMTREESNRWLAERLGEATPRVRMTSLPYYSHFKASQYAPFGEPTLPVPAGKPPFNVAMLNRVAREVATTREETKEFAQEQKELEAAAKLKGGLDWMKAQDVWAQQRAEREHYQRMGEEQAIRARAGEFMPRPTPREPEVPTMPGVAAPTYKFLEKMAEPVRGYAEREMGRVYEKWQTLQPGARAAWWAALHEPEIELEEAAQAELGTLGAELAGIIGAAQGPEPLGPSQQARYEQVMGERAEWGQWGEYGAREPSKPPKDPWLAHLEEYPWQTRYIEQPPGQRGFYPSRFRPPAKWR